MLLRRLLLAGFGVIALTAGAAQAGPFGIFGNRCQSGACSPQTASPTAVSTAAPAAVGPQVIVAQPAPTKTYRFPRLHPVAATQAQPTTFRTTSTQAPVFTGQLASQTRNLFGRIASFGNCAGGTCR